jgi:hypothetical protein
MKLAKQNLINREVEVDRKKLLVILHENRAKHIAEYNLAMNGYKTKLLEKIDEAYEKAKKSVDENYKKVREKSASLTDEQIKQQNDYITLLSAIDVEMKVPRCYDKEYSAAIDLTEWDVNDTMKLSYAEFTCFVKDEWDWKSDFNTVLGMYSEKN